MFAAFATAVHLARATMGPNASDHAAACRFAFRHLNVSQAINLN